MLQDLKHALRALRKQPGFTAIAVLTVALGVGANSAIFTVVDAVMLRPLPFRDPSRVVLVNERTPQFPVLSLSAENFRDVCREATTLQSCSAFRNFTANMSGGDEPQRIAAKMIGADVLPMLGVSPIRGRFFTPEEGRPNANRSAVNMTPLSPGTPLTPFAV